MGKTSFSFVYYYGVSYIKNNLIVGIDKEGNEIPIEEKLQRAASRNGSYIVYIIDGFVMNYN